MSFVHLHTHTQYSLLDGSNKIKDYIKTVKDMGMTAAAITDHGVMYGVIEFYREAKKQGINPILGCEVYVAPGSRFEKENVSGEDRYYHLILLAENDQGYSNLMKIVSVGFVDGYYYKPRVDFETIEKYHEGIICLSACVSGEVARLIRKDDYEGAKKTALKYRDCFGENNYFLELQDHGLDIQKKVNAGIMRLSKETGIELVCTNDCHYTKAQDAEPHDLLLCLQTGKTVSETNRMRYEGGQYYVKSEEEMRELFPYAPAAIENTQKIADRCHVDIEFGVTKLPHFETPEGYDSESYLKKLCEDGLLKRYGEDAEKNRPQLEYELTTIKEMGYVDYFLIVWDFINYARNQGISVGPGRGSAAGSIVSYCLGITDLDPVKYALIFERFLNPERVSMPDIDIDFADTRRGEVKDYVVEKYGEDCVTQIITFGTLKAKGVVRDVARVLEFPYAFGDAIAKAIPGDLGMTIDLALERNPELKSRYETEEDVKRVIDMSRKLEGLPRQAGIHAAGVVISQDPMQEYVPLARAKDGQIVTQFEKNTVEELGLLKMDFLGLKTLTVIEDAIDMVRRNHGVEVDFNQLGYEDAGVYKMIGTGRCEGVFQLESAGMKSFMKELKPQSLEDVIAGISLYRPGPMDFIPVYLRGKNGGGEVTYECPQLEPILSPTYGCIVYQEQVMQIVRDLAGFSLGSSDEIRRAMSKKKMDIMAAARKDFVYGNEETGIKGCIANGISEETANHIFDEMTEFAKYAFNKSHAACYGLVSYQTAWLRHHYPREFFAALLTSVQDNTAKVSNYINVCRGMGINVLPPDVNEGIGGFTAAEDGIRFGMYALKGVGTAAIDSLVREREERGPYTTLDNFLERNSGRDMKKTCVEGLIKSGGLDCLPANRREKLLVYATIMEHLDHERKHSIEGQMSLFDIAGESNREEYTTKIPKLAEYDKEELLAFEKEVMGVYLSGHPLDEYRGVIEDNATATAVDFVLEEAGDDGDEAVSSSPKLNDRARVCVGGMITEVKPHYTKNSQAMAFLTLEDLTGSIECIVFPRSYEKNRDLIEEEQKAFITGTVSVEDEKNAKLFVNAIYPFESLPCEVWIRFEDMDDYNAKWDRIYPVITSQKGADNVIIYINNPKSIKKISGFYNISRDEGIKNKLFELFGDENVILKPKLNV